MLRWGGAGKAEIIAEIECNHFAEVGIIFEKQSIAGQESYVTPFYQIF